MEFSTKSIHVGQEPEKTTGAVIPPIFMTSTYAQEAPAQIKGYDYTRAGNPNFTNLEQTLASLENGSYATVFSSGLGAINAIASTLKPGDTVIAVDDLYGGTYRIFTKFFEKYGIHFKLVHLADLEVAKQALSKKPQMMFIETPTNPLLRIVDIEKLSEIAHTYGTKVVVDNTFASPCFQNPLDLGADVVMHSTTKYIGGHSDVIGGVVISNDNEFNQEVFFARMALGLNPSPFDAWMISRSLKTLELRMLRHQENAFKIAHFLESHPKVKHVYYPGLTSHAGHEIAKKQMKGFSGIVSVEFDMSLEETKKLISSFKYFRLAESLGGVESLVDHPASMTHASIPKEEREKMGLMDGLVRISCGVENGDDLVKDLEQTIG
jgi:cystathionine beta-lyase/cystathionine gamma-synthase